MLTTTVCAWLGEPRTAAAKVNCVGLTLRPETTWPEPLSETETGVTLMVAEVMIKVAELPPTPVGEKVTATVQLLPAVKSIVQVEVPVAKLLAEGPVIWKPTLAADRPPLLVMVRMAGALTTPIFWAGKVRLTGLTTSAAGCTPVPESETVCVRSASETVSVPAWLPSWTGAKVTWSVQAECPAS